jgi:hypothetical protein
MGRESYSLKEHVVHVDSAGMSFFGSMVALNEFCKCWFLSLHQLGESLEHLLRQQFDAHESKVSYPDLPMGLIFRSLVVSIEIE